MSASILNSRNKLKRMHSAFRADSRARSEECIWEIEGKTSTISREGLRTSWGNRRTSHTNGKEFVKIVTRDGVRNLLVPSTKPNLVARFVSERELHRLQACAKIQTVEDKMSDLKRKQDFDEKLKNESERRKQKLRDIDMEKETRFEDMKEASTTDESDNLKLLSRAYLAKQEREEEVKRANRIILAAKCSIIRDAQIAEKNEIAREFINENQRLEKMMLVERDKALAEEELKREQEKKNLLKYSEQIRHQLEEKESLRVREFERASEEAQAMRKALEAIEKDEKEKARIKTEKTRTIREGLQKSSYWSQFFKNLEFEEEKIAELKVQEYMRQKLEREKKLALEKRMAQEEKEKEYTRILQRQQKLQESMTERSELEYRRQREEVDREFRRREKEAAKKKLKDVEEIAKARHIQLEEVKRQRAMQIARDEANFKEFMDKLRAEKERDEARKKTSHENKYKYRGEILSQITEKQRRRREEEDRQKREQLAQVEAERQREQNIKHVIQSKIKDMKRSNIPEKFIKDVERQLNILRT